MNNHYQTPTATLGDKTPDSAMVRWATFAYVLAVLGIGAYIGVNHVALDSNPVRIALLSHGLMILTYPLGAVASSCVFGLIYTGIGKMAESFFVCTPVYLIAGLVQWRVIVPWAVRKLGEIR